MKILLVSDNHGDIKSIRKVYLKHQDMDLYLHAGDSELPPVDILPFSSIKGNCDYFLDYPFSKVINTPLGKLLISHSHNVIIDELIKNDVKIYCHGHTHIKRFEKIKGIYFINPGSLTRPRDCSKGSYALIEISNNDIKVEFKYL